jgi:hypothetical protein
MSDRHAPAMSVVIVTPDRYETIRKTMNHLRAQTVKNRLEVVIVAPSAEKLDLDDSELADFLQFCVVEVGAMKSTAEARAAGVRQASAWVVAFLEDHSYPCSGWAEALIKAHQQSWAGVGPVIVNANPDSMVSWADMFLRGGRVEPTEAGMSNDLPGRNSSYKRALLLKYGPELEAMLELETLLHWDLQAQGHQLYLEPAAKTYHQNLTRLSPFLREQFYVGRLFAASRARRWLPFRRLLYTVGTPLIPPVRLWRILPELRHSGRRPHLLLHLLPALTIGLVVSAVGELTGYAFGAGRASQRLCPLEFHRDRY